jgi:ATP-dependent RNA helicase DHX57
VESEEGAGIPKLFERSRGRVFVHPSSINFSVTKYDTGWMVYSDIVETSKVFVRQCSSVPVYALLLFGGVVQVHHMQSKVSVDTWASVSAAPKIGVLVRELKKRLDALLSVKLAQPDTEISSTATVSVVIDLLVTDGK